MNKAALFAIAALGYLLYANRNGDLSRSLGAWIGERVKPSISRARSRSRGLLRIERGSRKGLLDLNAASEEELAHLEGMDDVLAERVIENRPYHNKLELLDRFVVPVNTYRAIKDEVAAKAS